MTKKQCEIKIIKAIELAKKNGFKVYVASDEEGNSFNEINPSEMFYMLYGNTKKDSIVLAVWKFVEVENDIFDIN